VDDDESFKMFLAALPQHYTMHQIRVALENPDEMRYA
jgi:hypothetical protein